MTVIFTGRSAATTADRYDAPDDAPDFDTSPDGFDTSPDGCTSPDGFDTSPDGFDTSPDGFDTSPDGFDTSPGRSVPNASAASSGSDTARSPRYSLAAGWAAYSTSARLAEGAGCTLAGPERHSAAS